MNSSRPVIYAGEGSAGGHCWVMDGYDNDTFFHFNWGWSGNYDGFYTVNEIAPPTGDTFNDYQEAIIRIIADTPVKNTGVVQVNNSTTDMQVFPNPASGLLNITSSGTIIKEISITDIAGREMKTFETGNTTEFTMQISDIPNGVYILRVQTEQGVISKKVVIAR